MGWWSATIMGGDPALDWRGDFKDIAGIKSGELKASDIETNIDGMIKAIRNTDFDMNVGWQVLGALILGTGAYMSDSVRKEILANAHDDPDMGWCNPKEREFFLEDFRDKVTNYKNGEIVNVASEGVLEKIIKGEEAKGDKRKNNGALKALQNEMDKTLKRYFNEVNEIVKDRVKYHRAIRNMILDIMHICKKYKVDFIGTSADAIELFEKEVEDEQKKN